MLPAISGGFAGATFQRELRCRLQDRKTEKSERPEVRETESLLPGGREVRKDKIKIIFFLLSGVLVISVFICPLFFKIIAQMVAFLLPLICCQNEKLLMKSSELHRKVKKNGWIHVRTDGSHYIYEKNGRTYPVPYHGAKEIGKGLEKKIVKEMGLQ